MCGYCNSVGVCMCGFCNSVGVCMCGYCNCVGVQLMCNMYTSTLRLHWLRFFRAFSSVVRQMPWLHSQRRGTAHTLPN